MRREGERVGQEVEKESRQKGLARDSGANRLERKKVGRKDEREWVEMLGERQGKEREWCERKRESEARW